MSPHHSFIALKYIKLPSANQVLVRVPDLLNYLYEARRIHGLPFIIHATAKNGSTPAIKKVNHSALTSLPQAPPPYHLS